MDQNTIINIKELEKLASDFALPCIVRSEEVTIIGHLYLLVFQRQEKGTCQLKQII